MIDVKNYFIYNLIKLEFLGGFIMTLMEDLLIKGYIDENMNERVKNSTADYIVRLLTFCAKSDGNISSKERDYIIDYIENNTVYDVNLIWDNIIRTMNISDIQKNFALQYIIKENEKPRKNDSNVVIAVIVNHESAMEYLLEYLEELRNNYQIRIYSKDKNLLNKYDLCKYDVFYYSNILN